MIVNRRKRGRFSGQLLVVTGGAGGIGGMVVSRFLNDGGRVAIVDIDKQRGKLKMEELASQGMAADRTGFYECDISVRSNCFETVGKIVRDMGNIHHFVNSVAYFGSKSLGATEKDWDRTMKVNVAGVSFMVQALAEQMKGYSEAENCSIVIVSSISAHQAQPDRWTYSASKGALNIMAKNMALDLAKHKIRVNTVSPGWVWSPEVAKAAGGDRSKWEPLWGKFHIAGRLAEMSEIAAAILFLCSKDAGFINATDLKVDGGYGAMSAEGFGEQSSFAGTKA